MDGLLVLCKTPGMSSSTAVSIIRKLSGEKRAGHMGTLDPGAAGVLLIGLGRGARLFDLLVEKRKEYVCEIAFGQATETQDVFGAVTEKRAGTVTRERLESVLKNFVGEGEQIAPAFSACKVNGQKMYELARAGQTVPEKHRTVTIDALECLEQTGENRFLLRIGCSRGTYIRTLCRDIGDAAGMPAHMAFLLRSECGPFSLAESHTVEECRALAEEGRLSEAVIPCEKALFFLPALHLEKERETPARNGLPTRLYGGAESGEEPEEVLLYAGETFLGVGEIENYSAKLKVHLYERE